MTTIDPVFPQAPADPVEAEPELDAPELESDEDVKRPAESPEAYFRRVATRRCNFALAHLYRLENTADRRLGYAYTAEQACEIVGTLREAVERLSVLYASTDEPKRVSL